MTATQGPGARTYRWRGVTRGGRQQSGCITLPPGGLAAHVDALFRAGWRYLMVCSGEGPVPPRFGEENQVAGIDKHPDTGKRTGWWEADEADPPAPSHVAAAVFPPGCNYDVTRAAGAGTWAACTTTPDDEASQLATEREAIWMWLASLT